MNYLRNVFFLVVLVSSASALGQDEDPASEPTTAPTPTPSTLPTSAPTEDAEAEEPTSAPTEDAEAEEPTSAPTEDVQVVEPTTAPTEDVEAEAPTSEPTTDAEPAATATEPVGFFGEEPDSSSEEWPDCVASCGHEGEPLVFDLRDFQLDGLRGVIDGNRHTFRVSGATVTGPDIDLFGIRGWGRMMVEITVEPAGSASIMDPVITTHDGFKAITYNSDRAAGDRTARAVVAHPYINGELPFYVVVEDATNYESYGSGGALVGGPEYGYIVRFAASDFAPTELGTLDGEKPQLTVTGAHLEQGGDIHYYRFYSAFSAQPSVTFTRTGSEAFIGVLAGMDTVGGQLVWERVVHDDASNPTGAVTLPSDGFDVCFEPCEAGLGEYIFAVLDWSGAAFPGEFTYDLTVTLE